MRQISYATAANEAMLEEMRRDPKAIYLATDAPGSLVKEFGDTRVRGTPITEAKSRTVWFKSLVCSRTIEMLYECRLTTSTFPSRSNTTPLGARKASVR